MSRALAAGVTTFLIAAGQSAVHPLSTHSIPPSFVPRGTATAWHCSGACQQNSDGSFSLLPSLYGVKGALWNPIRLDLLDFELDVLIQLGGVLSESAGGFGIWLTNSTVIDELARYPNDKAPWNLLGFTNQFGGWGVGFGTRDRTDEPRQSISLLSNPSRDTLIDPIKNVPSGAGIYWTYKKPGVDSLLNLRVVSKGGEFWGLVKYSADKEWQRVFLLKNSDGFDRHRGYLVLTGSNARATNKPAVGLAVTIKRISLQVDGPTSLSPKASMSSMVDRARASVASGDVVSGLSAIIDLLSEHVIPAQHGMEYSVLHKLDAAVTELKSTAMQNNEQYVAELQGVRQKLKSQGIEEIKDHAQNIDASVRAATSRAHWSTIILGCVFVGFALVIYKRMTDIEKKHYL